VFVVGLFSSNTTRCPSTFLSPSSASASACKLRLKKRGSCTFIYLGMIALRHI
ncbi:hypothetical protein FRX31_002649, partial [Thalictrum thalictroides]